MQERLSAFPMFIAFGLFLLLFVFLTFGSRSLAYFLVFVLFLSLLFLVLLSLGFLLRLRRWSRTWRTRRAAWWSFRTTGSIPLFILILFGLLCVLLFGFMFVLGLRLNFWKNIIWLYFFDCLLLSMTLAWKDSKNEFRCLGEP